MKIIETVEVINSQKVFIGDREVELQLETETGRVSIATPAMFTNPVVRLDELKAKLEKLEAHMDRERSAE